MSHPLRGPIIFPMRPPAQPTRYTLVPRPAANPGVRRYSLVRIAPSPRSALGADRHERLERAASAFRQA